MQSSKIPVCDYLSDSLIPPSNSLLPPTLSLPDQFQSRSSLLKYLNGIVCSDGSISIYRKGGERLEATVRFCQSNLSFLTAINEVFGNKGHITTNTCTRANVIEGRYSKGEMRQMLSFGGKAAGEVAAELAPYTVTKDPHIEALLAFVHLPAGPSEAKKQLYYRIQDLNDKGPDDNTLKIENITPEWLSGFFDGDGSICVSHTVRNGRTGLELNVTQSKSPTLLLAIQNLYPGTIQHNPPRLVWGSAKTIPAIYKVLSMHLVMKKQKLNSLLQSLFKVDISRNPISGSGTRKAFTCSSPAEGWTAASWCDYLHEPLLPWSR